MIDGPHQFLYVVAGDGSTHVVDRSFDEDALGVECDTQLDPTLAAQASACNPIDPNAVGNTPDRRPFARGPGIRSADASINDWMFDKVTAENIGDFNCTSDPNSTDRGPYCRTGLVGVGISSFGRVVYATFGQYADAGSTNPLVDPVGVMNITVTPHSLWPQQDPTVEDPDPSALPVVADELPHRALPGADDTTQVLAPALRRIDLAYAAAPSDVDISADRATIAENLGNPGNVDLLGQFDGSGLYENEVVRVADRDFEAWDARQWIFQWEGGSTARPAAPDASSATPRGSWPGLAVRGTRSTTTPRTTLA